MRRIVQAATHAGIVPLQQGSRGLAFAALTAAGCFWGTGFLLGKIALAELSVAHMIFYRFVFATLGFLPLLLFYPVRIRAADWSPLLVASFLGVPVMFLIQFEGLAHTTVSHAVLMVGTSPVLLALSAFIVFREKMGIPGWLALAVSTVGVALVLLHAGTGHNTTGSATTTPTVKGDLLVFVSLFAGVTWMLINKHLMRRYSPIVVSACITLSGAVMLGIWVLLRYGPPPVLLSPGTWFALAGQGLLATTLATVLWNWGMSHVQAGHAGVFMNFEPVIGTILGVTLLHEPLSAWVVVGGILIVGAAVVVTWQES
jgi:drug/metabolite transporter (DMT)-like permease